MRPDGGSRPVTTDADAYEYDGAGTEWFGPGTPGGRAEAGMGLYSCLYSLSMGVALGIFLW